MKVLPLLHLRHQHSASLLGFRWVVKRKMEESNPYDIVAASQFSRLLAVHSVASSKLNNGSWRSRTPTVVNCTPVFETGCRPLGSSFPNFGCIASIQNNDSRKFQACLEKGIELAFINCCQQKSCRNQPLKNTLIS